MLGQEPPARAARPSAAARSPLPVRTAGPCRLGARLRVSASQVLNGCAARCRSSAAGVMKNVAGYDVSRLMAGAWRPRRAARSLVQVLLRPVAECTLVQEATQAEAIGARNRWVGQPLPLSASAWDDGRLSVRLSEAAAAVEAAARTLGGERLDPVAGRGGVDGAARTDACVLRRRRAALAPVGGTGECRARTGRAAHRSGAGRSAGGATTARQPAARPRGGCRRSRDVVPRRRAQRRVFQPLAPGLAKLLQAELKRSFDPHGIFNPGRLYAGL